MRRSRAARRVAVEAQVGTVFCKEHVINILIIVLTVLAILGLIVYLGKRRIIYEKKELQQWKEEYIKVRMKWHELEFERILVALDLLGIRTTSELQKKELKELLRKYSQVVETKKLWQ
jgi:hypothetical protein